MKSTEDKGTGIAVAVALLVGMIALGFVTIAIMSFISEFIF